MQRRFDKLLSAFVPKNIYKKS